MYEQHKAGERPLDSLLDKLAQGGQQLVLILPEQSDQNANLPWIRERCAAGLHFASARIRERMGAVTRIEVKSPVLAAVAFELAHGVKEQEQKQPIPAVLSEQKEVVALADRVCQLARRTNSEKELARWAFEPVIHGDAKDAREQNAVTAPFHPTAVAPEFLDPTRTRVKLIDGKAGERPLDSLLDKLAQGGQQLVLILPEQSDQNANLPWIRERCAAGLHFASARIRERMGAVTRIEVKSPVLAAVAFELAHGVKEQEQKQPIPAVLSEQKEVVALADRVCQLARRTNSEKELARWAFEPVIHGDAKDAKEQNAVTAPFHPTAVAPEFLDPTRTRVKLIDGKAGVADNALRKNVVYIGSTYDVRDRYTTAEGEQASLHLHAAAHTSLGIGTADVNKYAVFAADIFIGILLGCLFGGLWTLYGRAELAIDKRMEDPDISRLHRMGTLAEFYGIRAILVVVWASPVLIGVLAVYLSHGLLEQGWWVNPGPLIAGMFLHAMSLRDEAHHPHEEVPGLNVWAQLRRTHPGIVLVQAPLAVILFIIAVA